MSRRDGIPWDKSPKEQEYIEFLWDAFETNYTHGKYQFAFLAYHMLAMSFVYFNIWQIRQTEPKDFAMGLIGFGRDIEKSLLEATSPFVFSTVNVRSILRFLKLIACDNGKIGTYAKLVDDRNDTARPVSSVSCGVSHHIRSLTLDFGIFAAMSPTEKIPSALAEKFAAITALTDAFCEKHLNDEYRVLIHRLVGGLARKRPSPLLKGKENVWAAAAAHAVGHVNFLDDPSQLPHCKPKSIYEFFSVAESTGQNKSRQIREAFGMGPMSPEWTLPSRLADNPLVWMLQVNGLMIDIRQAPAELQRLAYEKGLIPFIPAKRSDADA